MIFNTEYINAIIEIHSIQAAYLNGRELPPVAKRLIEIGKEKGVEIEITYGINCENESSINHVTPPDAKHLLADSASIKDLIHRDISRCNDDRCPTAPFCERYLQMAIDYKKGEKLVSVTDFKGREKVGLCDHFLNVDVV